MLILETVWFIKFNNKYVKIYFIIHVYYKINKQTTKHIPNLNIAKSQ